MRWSVWEVSDDLLPEDGRPLASFPAASQSLTRDDTVKQVLLLVLAGVVGGLACAGLILGFLAVTRPTALSFSPASTAQPSAAPTLEATPAPIPTPETCLLGHPNSGDTVIVELTGPGAAAVCDDLTNPVRTAAELSGTRALATNSWAPYRACQYTKYGLTWTVWDSINAPITDGPFARKPGRNLCP